MAAREKTSITLDLDLKIRAFRRALDYGITSMGDMIELALRKLSEESASTQPIINTPKQLTAEQARLIQAAALMIQESPHLAETLASLVRPWIEPMQPPRKPARKVMSIRPDASGREDVITDEDLRPIADLQAAEWRIQQQVQDAVAGIRERIAAGARIESVEYAWDPILKMVRSRKERRA